jgi:hypothetical protein
VDSLRLLLSFALNTGLQIHQLDVCSAFLTFPLKEKVTLFPPPGFACPPGTVLELRKAIYGLKHGSKAWYERLKGVLGTVGFKATSSDPCFFTLPDAPNRPAMWIFAHFNNLVIISKDPLHFKTKIESKFDIKYLGQAEFLLGMNIDRSPGFLHIHQAQYIKRKLDEYGLDDAPIASCPLDPKSHLRAATVHEAAEFKKLGISYRGIIGSLNYLSVLTCPNVLYAVSVPSQHLENPGMSHFQAAQQVLCYL